MAKILKLNVTYLGSYGGNIDDTLILPYETNGLLFNISEDVTIEDEIDLGEIEGKHSECFGDLKIEVLNLDVLSAKEVSALIKESDFSNFEIYFQGLEIAMSEFQEEKPEHLDQSAIDGILQKYGVDKDSYGVLTSEVHDNFIEKLKKKYVTEFKVISVSEEDYELAKELLTANGIKSF